LLSSRGTDINTDLEVENNGGMHVSVTFLPKNQRVQDQAFGRSARKGQKGTCQMILNKGKVQRQLNRVIYDDSDIMKLRNERESEIQKSVKNKYLSDTLAKDEMFSLFSNYLQKDDRCKNKNHRAAVVENWGIWLKTQSHKKNKEQEKEYEAFQNH
jgi:hypothetical protein